MIPVTELRAGRTFQIDGTPYQVIKYNHIKMGRGNAVIRVSVRNLRTGTVSEKSFNSGSFVEAITTTRRKLQFLYEDAQNAVFMDPATFEQQEILKNVLSGELPFLKEGQETDVLFWEDNALSVDLPPNVTLAVTETAPGEKGNSATNVYKPATLENGLKIKVPLFIKVGDKVKVDTRTSEYVERVKWISTKTLRR